MGIPMLQIALDNLSLVDALATTRLIHREVEILEVGTILTVAEGVNAIRVLKTLYPDNIVLADIKAADAGAVFAGLVFDAGADWMSAISSAAVATIAAAAKEAKIRGKEIQIELYGDWTMAQARQWWDAGVKQVVYHKGREDRAAGKSWGEADRKIIRELADLGFQVSVAGGLEVEDIPLFKGLPITAFVAGRGIREAKDPVAVARKFREVIKQYWG
jgi:3-dehydro-L-gulonate-6-phosphate decarboxylase